MKRIFLIGFMGSGKTHWGTLLARQLELPFFDLDKVISDAEQQPVTNIFTGKGEEYFRYKEKQLLEELVQQYPLSVISCGGGTPCFFNNIDFMKENGTVVWLYTAVDTLVARLMKEKNTRPLIKDIPDKDLKAHILRKLQDRKIYYEQADLIVHEEDLTIERFAEILANA